MSKQKWSPENVEQLHRLARQGLSARQIAQRLGRTKRAVQTYLWSAGLSLFKIRAHGLYPDSPPVSAPEQPVLNPKISAGSSVEEDLQASAVRIWKSRHDDVLRKYQKTLEEFESARLFREVAVEAAPKSYEPAPPVIRSKSSEVETAQSMLLMLSDSHVGKEVKPSQTLEFGEYNFDIFLDRLRYLVSTVVSIREHHVPTPIDKLYIAVLGDMIEGALKHVGEARQLDAILNMVYQAAHAFAQAIRSLAAHFPVVDVICVVGNHARQLDQHKMPMENRHSNFDGFLYVLLEQLLKDIPNINFVFNEQPFQEFRIYDSYFLACHGEHLRGGDRILGIPAHALGRMVSSTVQNHVASRRTPPNFYLVGHLHREIDIPHALGHILYNGAFVGSDALGVIQGFQIAEPSQRLFCVHPKYGRTASWSISLQHATPGSGRDAFEVPVRFPLR